MKRASVARYEAMLRADERRPLPSSAWQAIAYRLETDAWRCGDIGAPWLPLIEMSDVATERAIANFRRERPL